MESGERKKLPGFTGKAYPEVFNTIPPQPQQLKCGQIPEEQVKKFFDEGFLVLDNFFQEEELDPAKDAVNELVDELAHKLYNGGKITSLYSEYGYEKRLTMMEAEFPGSNILLHKLGKLPKAFQDIWANKRLLNVAEQLIGSSDLIGHPVWNLRCKTPASKAATVPWHQDTAYLDTRSYDVFQLTAWIPLVNATVETGCMQDMSPLHHSDVCETAPIDVIEIISQAMELEIPNSSYWAPEVQFLDLGLAELVRYGHKSGLTATHQCCADGTWYVMLSEDEMRRSLGCNLESDIVTCEVKYGSVLIFNNLLPHQSLMNKSDIIRWSLDMRWQRADRPVGFYDLKEGVRLRSSTDPNLVIDWDSFNAVSRHEQFGETVETSWHSENVDFDTTVIGPWMLKWDVVNKTRHTDAVPDSADPQWGHLIVG